MILYHLSFLPIRVYPRGRKEKEGGRDIKAHVRQKTLEKKKGGEGKRGDCSTTDMLMRSFSNCRMRLPGKGNYKEEKKRPAISECQKERKEKKTFSKISPLSSPNFILATPGIREEGG